MLKIHCDLCHSTMDETAIMPFYYGNGRLYVCIQCLTEGILEIANELKKEKKENKPAKKIKAEYVGFKCEQCGTVLFTGEFPVECACGHVNGREVLDKQFVEKAEQEQQENIKNIDKSALKKQ